MFSKNQSTKMVYTIVLISIVSLLGIDASIEILKLSPEMIEKIKAVDNQCVKSTGATSESLHQMIPWRLTKDEINQRYLYCFCNTLKLTNDHGVFDVNPALNLFRNSNKQADIMNAVLECNALKGKDKYETTYIITDCFYDKAPVKLTF